MNARVAVAYLWGTDAFGIDEGVRAFATEVSPEEPIEVWRMDAEGEADEDPGRGGAGGARRRSRRIDEIEMRLSMSPLLGPGTLVVVRQPGGLLADSASRERLTALVGTVPSGNALCFADLVGADGKLPAARAALREAVAAAGGPVREYVVPTRERMEAWLVDRAGAMGVTLDPRAARELATRVGAHVREGDVDRRRQTQLAHGELEKLALYRPGGRIGPEDVAALVAESVPGSTWAFLDAVGSRDARATASLLERLIADGAVLPVLVTQLHRRIRELLIARDHLDAGARPGDLVRTMRLAPFRAQKLAEQASRWTLDELGAALEGILELDLRSKGIALDGRTVQMSESHDLLALEAWVAEHARVTRGRRVAARA